jgi:predicted dehydrogenase
LPISTDSHLEQPVLIAGFGSIGRRHFRNLRAMGYKNFVFHRTHSGTVPDDELADWPSFGDIDAALKLRPAIAVISNPTARHIEVAAAAADAGCDLFIEKPVSASMDGCDELLDCIRGRNLIAAVGCQFRFHPLLIRLRDEIRSGRCGAVIGARAEWGEYLPDWHPWEDHRQSYSARPELGGGALLTLIHPLDYLYWLFGPVSRVQAVARSVPSLQTTTDDDWAEVSLNFESSVVAQVHVDFWQRPPVHRLAVWGETGRAVLDFNAGALEWESEGQDAAAAQEQLPSGFERNTMFIDEMRSFVASVLSRQRPAVPLEDGIAVLKIALEAKQSARGDRVHA